MGDEYRRLVPDPPAAAMQAPDQVNVFSCPQLGIKPIDRFERGAANDEGGGRDIGHPASGLDPAGHRAEIERRPYLFVTAKQRRTRSRTDADAGGHGPNSRVTEMIQERRQPVAVRLDIRVDEDDDWSGGGAPTPVPSCSRSDGSRVL
jgi:hypothetical protein